MNESKKEFKGAFKKNYPYAVPKLYVRDEPQLDYVNLVIDSSKSFEESYNEYLNEFNKPVVCILNLDVTLKYNCKNIAIMKNMNEDSKAPKFYAGYNGAVDKEMLKEINKVLSNGVIDIQFSEDENEMYLSVFDMQIAISDKIERLKEHTSKDYNIEDVSAENNRFMLDCYNEFKGYIDNKNYTDTQKRFALLDINEYPNTDKSLDELLYWVLNNIEEIASMGGQFEIDRVFPSKDMKEFLNK